MIYDEELQKHMKEVTGLIMMGRKREMVYRFMDTETSGLTEKDDVVQIAWCDCVIEESKFICIDTRQMFVDHEKELVYSEVVPNKTPNEFLQEYGTHKEGVRHEWQDSLFDVLLAYNAPFDVRMIKDSLQVEIDEGKAIFDVQRDLPWKKEASLIHQCADHGILVHDGHNALTDVMAMINLMNAQKLVDLNNFEAYIKAPYTYYLAKVTFDQKDKAKQKGYNWLPSHKVWWKRSKVPLENLEPWEQILSETEGKRLEDVV
jgi:hypothetical protein